MNRKSAFRIIFSLMFIMILLSTPLAGKTTAAQLEMVDQAACDGQVTFTLSVNDAPNEIECLGVDINYDQSLLEYLGADFSGTFMQDWSFKKVSNPNPGFLRLGGFTIQNAIAFGSSGLLVKLTFNVIGAQNCQLTLSNLEDGLFGWTTKDGSFTYIAPKTWYRDADGDGYGNPKDSVVACEEPAGFVLGLPTVPFDCDDNDSKVYLGQTWYRDADGDGYGNRNDWVFTCEQPAGFVLDNKDCNDNNPKIYYCAMPWLILLGD